MKSVHTLLLSVVFTAIANQAMAGGNILHCDATTIEITPSKSLEVILMSDDEAALTVVGWDSPPNSLVVVSCVDGRLTIGGEGDETILIVLSPQEGAKIEQ